jgi:hypothetical protein
MREETQFRINYGLQDQIKEMDRKFKHFRNLIVATNVALILVALSCLF